MVRWSRVKPSFPRISHDAEETGNERESKHGGGSLQFWEDCWLILLAKTRLIWHLWNQFAFEAYFPRLAAFGCRENGCDGYRSLKWRLLYLNFAAYWQLPSKLFRKTVSKGKLKTKSCCLRKFFFFYSCFTITIAQVSIEADWVLLCMWSFYNLYSGKIQIKFSVHLSRARHCFEK